MSENAKSKIKKGDILDYHLGKRPGKIEVIPTKPSNSQRDLSIAYSPGVAEPCLEIQKNPADAYKYTAKSNLVAVITNGTAVLGLGNIGALASKPVMEGKGVLFKIFADIDVFDLELDTADIEKFIETVKILAPTFGGINLEDIKAPDCFEIEQRLRDELDIPIMHDDQHGTAIITGAALINALSLATKKIEEVKVVFNGAGASAISCATLFISLGVRRSNLFMLDSKGLICNSRKDLNSHKKAFIQNSGPKNLEETIKNADVFVGLSKGNILSKHMVKSMAKDAIVFALANPDPEISYANAIEARSDIIMATGRSDNPNMVNNVLGFPYIFRGALDVRAKTINEEMKLAAVRAIAELARETVPEVVSLAYNQRNIAFGKDYIIPKPFDPRLITKVASAVAKAAMESGVASEPIIDWEKYKEKLLANLGRDDKFIRLANEKAKSHSRSIVLTDGESYKVLKAAQIISEDGIAKPTVLGNRKNIDKLVEKYSLDLKGVIIEDPAEQAEKVERFTELYYDLRKRKGVTLYEAEKNMLNKSYYGTMMLETGEVDALLTGNKRKYPSAIKPVLEIIGLEEKIKKISGIYILLTKDGPLFLADTTINTDPTKEEIVEIVEHTASTIKKMSLEPKIALLSYSNFGSHKGVIPKRMQDAGAILREKYPDLIVDGEMQANFAMDNELLAEVFPFSTLVGKKPNALIFPDLASGNIAYKLLQTYGSAEAIGPVLVGLKKSAHVLQMGSSVREIVNMATLAVIAAQEV